MPTPSFNPERAARILVEAEINGVSQTAKNWGITRETISNYRRRVRTDTGLSHLFTLKKKEMAAKWAEKLAKAIEVGLDELIVRMPMAEEEAQAKAIHAIAGAIKIVGEFKLNNDVLHGTPVEPDQN